MAKRKIICDTDVMIDYWDKINKRHSVTKETLEGEVGLENVMLSAVTKMELMAGAINKADLEIINKKLSKFNILLINQEITLKAFELFNKYLLSHKLSLPDCLIASTALNTRLELLTYNTKDFKFISELALVE